MLLFANVAWHYRATDGGVSRLSVHNAMPLSPLSGAIGGPR